jgi:hypothetical protein
MEADLAYEQEVNVIGRYVFAHPQWRRAFPDSTPAQVVIAILKHLKRNTVRIANDRDGSICGVLFFTPNNYEQIINVDHMIGSNNMIIDAALIAWSTEYPNYDVTLKRRGKPRYYRFTDFFKPVDAT